MLIVSYFLIKIVTKLLIAYYYIYMKYYATKIRKCSNNDFLNILFIKFCLL